MGFSNPASIPGDLAREASAFLIESAAQNAETNAGNAETAADNADTNVQLVQSGEHGYLARDRIYWPCFSGEDFAPALTNCAYTLFGIRSAIENNGTTAIRIEYPKLPLRHPRDSTLTAIRFSALIRIAENPGSEIRIGIGRPGTTNPWCKAEFTPGESANWQLVTDTGIESQQLTNVAVPTNQWVEVAVILAPTYQSLEINGAEEARETGAGNILQEEFSREPSVAPMVEGGTWSQEGVYFTAGVEARWIDPT